MDAIQTIGLIVAIVVGIVGLVGTVAALRSWSTSAANQARIERLEADVASFTASNHELRAEIDWKNEQIRAAEAAHKVTVAELDGKVTILTGELVKGLVDSFRAALAEALSEVLGRSERREP